MSCAATAAADRWRCRTTRRLAGILPQVNVPEVPKWAMPWVTPTGTVTQEALRALDRPLLAWPNGEFDAEEHYEGFAGSEMSTLERAVRKLGARPTWRMERVWFPDGEARRRRLSRTRRRAGTWPVA
jgi:hypothetical protein